MNRSIDGNCYARMLMGGAATLAKHTEELNDMNVFPVSDGDTGTNMLKTLYGGLEAVHEGEHQCIGDLIEAFSRGVLLAARGNSGVILSQIFAGIKEALSKSDNVTAKDLAKAYKAGIKKSYAAVQNPTEGTILTVFRESTEYAASQLDENSSVEDFFRLHIEQAHRSLASTKDLLPALREADVVDSGAAGYLYIAEGMYEALDGKAFSFDFVNFKDKNNTVNIDSFTRDSVLEYGYCTEFLLRLTTNKVNPDEFDVKTAVSALEALGGESIVAYKEGDIVKVHVHTFKPGEVLLKLQDFGEFLTVKVENMSLGHSETHKPKKPAGVFSVVSVANGEGIRALFTHMGADVIVSGGQSENPSTEDFIEAFRKCETPHIVVFPNNKNIMLAATQAAKLYTEACVHVIESKSIMQGYCGLGVVTPGIKDMDVLIKSISNAIAGITDCSITKAVRDASVDGVSISCGDYMAIVDGKIVSAAKSRTDAVLGALESTDTDLCEIITLISGKNVSDDERRSLTELIKEKYDDCEVIVYEGGQDVYDYLLAVE